MGPWARLEKIEGTTRKEPKWNHYYEVTVGSRTEIEARLPKSSNNHALQYLRAWKGISQQKQRFFQSKVSVSEDTWFSSF